ncbi:MAG: hypothetical protein WC417_01665 [Candidatus Omnitrophota bacterium]|jgi:hypothetical protein
MNILLRSFNFVAAAGLIALIAAGCIKKPDESRVVARVNKYLLTVQDFRHEAEAIPCQVPKDAMLQDMIVKELLLQEAQKMKLDKNKAFMREIEDYWKQVLIKDLIDLKGREFLAVTRVSPQEINAEYARRKEDSDGEIGPLKEISESIRQELMLRKAQVVLDDWLASLVDNAVIKKNPAVLNGIQIKCAKILAGGSDGE